MRIITANNDLLLNAHLAGVCDGQSARPIHALYLLTNVHLLPYVSRTAYERELAIEWDANQR